MLKENLIKVILSIAALAVLLSACSAKKPLKKDAPFDPAAALSQSEQMVSSGEYEGARKILLEVRNRDATKKYAPLAQLRLADSYIKEGEFDLGVEEYKKFIDLYPDNQYAYYAQYQIAMAFFNQIESPDRGTGAAKRALKEFLAFKERYPRNPYREAVDLRIEKCRNVIADGQFIIAEFYYKKEAYQAAVSRFEALLKEFPDYKRADETLFLIGRSYRQLKNAQKAQEVFAVLLEKYPSSRFAANVRKGVK